MPIDLRRYPHFGGRKRPDECSVCHRIVFCHVVDSPDDTGEPVCPQCIVVAMDVAWEDRPSGPKGVKPTAQPEAMWAFLDEDCPSRGASLSHVINGTWQCIHCGMRIYRRRGQ